MNFNSSDKHHTTTFHFMALWINSNIFSFWLRERENNDQVTIAWTMLGNGFWHTLKILRFWQLKISKVCLIFQRYV